MFGAMAAGAFAGDPPEPPEMGPMPKEVVRVASSNGYSTTTVAQSVVYGGTEDPEWKAYEEEMKTYIEKRRLSSDVSNLLSPQMNYYTVAIAVTNPQLSSMIASPYDTAPEETTGLAGALGRVWMNIAALLVFPSAFFAATYVKFMRMDIR